ncbi:unnamed protein product [Choristocarpus tenellus]
MQGSGCANEGVSPLLPGTGRRGVFEASTSRLHTLCPVKEDRKYRLSTRKEREILACFQAFDQGGKGFLDKDDLKCAITALTGSRPTKYEVKRLLDAAIVQEPACPGVTQTFFLESMSVRIAQVDPAEEVREIFRAFDKRGRGFLTKEDLQEVSVSGWRRGIESPQKLSSVGFDACWLV